MARAADRLSCEACPATSWTYRKSLISGDHQSDQSDAFVVPVMVLTRELASWSTGPHACCGFQVVTGAGAVAETGIVSLHRPQSRVPRAFRVLTDSELQGPRPVSLLSPSWKAPKAQLLSQDGVRLLPLTGQRMPPSQTGLAADFRPPRKYKYQKRPEDTTIHPHWHRQARI
jgi:hypothetical protein